MILCLGAHAQVRYTVARSVYSRDQWSARVSVGLDTICKVMLRSRAVAIILLTLKAVVAFSDSCVAKPLSYSESVYTYSI